MPALQINAEAQRFAKQSLLFFSAQLCVLCLSALRFVLASIRVNLWNLCKSLLLLIRASLRRLLQKDLIRVHLCPSVVNEFDVRSDFLELEQTWTGRAGGQRSTMVF